MTEWPTFCQTHKPILQNNVRGITSQKDHPHCGGQLRCQTSELAQTRHTPDLSGPRHEVAEEEEGGNDEDEENKEEDEEKLTFKISVSLRHSPRGSPRSLANSPGGPTHVNDAESKYKNI